MQTMKDLLSQKIYEIPENVRNSFANIFLQEDSIVPMCAASLFVAVKLQKEDEDHPLTQFTFDRLEDVSAQTIGSVGQEINLSCDIDTLTFMRFACEYAIQDFDEFYNNPQINTTLGGADANTVTSKLHYCAIALTTSIAIVLNSEV